MSRRDLAELVALAALWGGSFLFMRIAVPAFGPFALAALRVAGASLLLLPMLAVRGELPALRRHWRPIAIVGVTNSAVPFACFAYAALTIDAGVSAIFNSATPLFAAVIALVADRLLCRACRLIVGSPARWIACTGPSAIAHLPAHRRWRRGLHIGLFATVGPSSQAPSRRVAAARVAAGSQIAAPAARGAGAASAVQLSRSAMGPLRRSPSSAPDSPTFCTSA